MPSMIGKEKKKKELIQKLDKIFEQLEVYFVYRAILKISKVLAVFRRNTTFRLATFQTSTK